MGWYLRYINNLNEHELGQTPEDCEGQRDLACHHPWGCKELDTIGWLNIYNTIIYSSSPKHGHTWGHEDEFFILLKKIFIFGCTGSSLLGGSSPPSCDEQRLMASCNAWASDCSGFSRCGAQALGHMGFSSCGA